MTKISVKSYLTKKVLEKQEKLRNDENWRQNAGNDFSNNTRKGSKNELEMYFLEWGWLSTSHREEP
jgi:hypothetical protein